MGVKFQTITFIFTVLALIVFEKRTINAKTFVLSGQGDSQFDTVSINTNDGEQFVSLLPLFSFSSLWGNKLTFFFIFLTQGNEIYCDGIQCPAKTKRCVLKKDSVPGKPEILIQRICKDGKGRQLYQEDEKIPQLDGPQDYHSLSETSVGGGFSYQGNHLSKSEEKQLENDLLDQAKALEEQTKNIGASIKNTISKALEGLFRRTNFPFN